MNGSFSTICSYRDEFDCLVVELLLDPQNGGGNGEGFKRGAESDGKPHKNSAKSSISDLGEG